MGSQGSLEHWQLVGDSVVVMVFPFPDRVAGPRGLQLVSCHLLLSVELVFVDHLEGASIFWGLISNPA